VTVTSRTTVGVHPTSGHTGAEITGVDLTRPLDDQQIADIRSALLRWKVVFFRDQDITPDQQVEFGKRFAAVTRAHPTLAGLEEQPAVLRVGSRPRSDGDAKSEHEDNNWHTDVTFVPNPPLGSILRAVSVPPYGGDTGFSNLVAAYEALSPALRTFLDGLHATHDNTFPAASREADRYGAREKFEAVRYESVHPVVRVHPETGERGLFVNINFTRRIVELSRLESNALLEFLYTHIGNPAFTTRFRWSDHSIAFWDNRAVAHLAPSDVAHLGFERVMHRITLAGDRPVGPDGYVSQAIVGDDFV
jgi:alpha-ketoglutarate-dependent taurine dioxygenase